MQQRTEIKDANIARVLTLLPESKREPFLYIYRDGCKADQKVWESFSDQDLVLILGSTTEVREGDERSLFKAKLARSGQKIKGYYMGEILKCLPERSRLPFVNGSQAELENGKDLAKIIPTLPMQERFPFAMANINLIRYKQPNRWNSSGGNWGVISLPDELSDDLMDVIGPCQLIEQQLRISAMRLKTWKEQGMSISIEYLESIKRYFIPRCSAFVSLKISDVDNFINWIKACECSINNVRKTAAIVSRYYNDQNSLFSTFPIELNHKVINSARDPQIHSENEAANIGRPFFYKK